MPFPKHPARQKRCRGDRTAARIWSATLETVNLRLDQLQLRESHWVIVDMVGKGGRLRTVPVPAWCKGFIDVWIHDTGVTEGKVFRRVSKNGTPQEEGVTTDVVWYAVKRYAKRIGH
jgi:integrase/recombinase XerD